MSKQPRGFIALISAILISGALLTLAASGSLSGITNRFVVLAYEDKLQSKALADACLSTLLLTIRTNPHDPGGEVVTVGTDTCTVSKGVGTNPRTFYIQAVHARTYTNLHVDIDTTHAQITSLSEIPTYPAK